MKTGYMLAMQNAHEGMSDAEMICNELRLAARAEAFGFDVVWCAEHHFDHYSIAPDNFQLLTWLAARTTNIQLGTAIRGSARRSAPSRSTHSKTSSAAWRCRRTPLRRPRTWARA